MSTVGMLICISVVPPGRTAIWDSGERVVLEKDDSTELEQ